MSSSKLNKHHNSRALSRGGITALVLCLFLALAGSSHAQIGLGAFYLEPADIPDHPIKGCPLSPHPPDVQKELISPSTLSRLTPVLEGKDWLRRRGVNVYYYSGPRTVLTKTFGTYAGECVDLVVRLYALLGMKNWDLYHAYEFAEVAKTRRGKITGTTEGFSHVTFYDNGSSRQPPAPGDILVFDATSDNPSGHVAVVNKVYGNQLEFVQQNIYDDNGRPLPRDTAFIRQDGVGGPFTITPAQGKRYSKLTGWINTPCMKRLVDSYPPDGLHALGGYAWNRDQSGVYVYLSEKKMQDFVKGDRASIEEIVQRLSSAGAIWLTTEDHVRCVVSQVSRWTRELSEFSPAHGVRAVDFTVKYTGRTLWVRPWGGPQDGKWIPKHMARLCGE